MKAKTAKKSDDVLKKRDVYTIVLEDLRSQFKAFGESLDDVKRNMNAVRKTSDATFEEVGRIKVEITEIKMNATGMKTEITGIKTGVAGIKKEITEIKTRLDFIEKRLSCIESKPAEAEAEIEFLKKESMEIKSCFDDKDIRERLNIFEARVGRIEKQLKLSAA